MKKLTFIFLLIANTILGQEFKSLDDFDNQLDKSSIETGFMINRTPITLKQLEYIRKNANDKTKTQQEIITTEKFKMLSEIIEGADFSKKKRSSGFMKYLNLTEKQKDNTAEVAVCIIEADVNFLNEEEIRDNIKNKKEGKKVKTKYEKLEILSAGLSYDKFYQGNITFKFDQLFKQSNKKSSIRTIEIDFNDNKGFRPIEEKGMTIDHQFHATGTQVIKIRLISNDTQKIFVCPIEIYSLFRPQPYIETVINVEKTDSKNAKVATSVAGAQITVSLGCDNVFDKPIIVAEGFDAFNSTSNAYIAQKYSVVLASFLSNGYDMVTVNYNDATQRIQDNAQVLKAVINYCNTNKIGNKKMVVVGESMSGLVARYALKQLENDGITHNVSHFIAYDSPFKGANVPMGMIKARRDIGSWVFPYSLFIDSFNKWFNFVPGLNALDSPAAKQMLINHQNGGGSHPDLISFQNELNALGYPSQGGIQNYAVVNGDLTGGHQTHQNGNLMQPGNKITELNSVFPYYLDLDIWTNSITQSTKIYEVQSLLSLPASFPYTASQSVNVNRNFDKLAGGRIGGYGSDFEFFANVSWLPTVTIADFDIASDFSFVPTFSAIDYKGSLLTDSDYTVNINSFLSNNNVSNPALSNFHKIYGDNFNDYHVDPTKVDEAVAWNKLFTDNFSQTVSTNICQPAPCDGGNFYGSFDVANCNTISGWMLDYNNLGRTIRVDIFVDNIYYSSIDANQNRFDLVSAFGSSPLVPPHGFTYQIPTNATFLDGGVHTITIKPCGTSNGPFVNASKTITCGSNPPPPSCSAGNFGGNMDTHSCTSISGWVLDWNNLSRTVNADIYVDGNYFGTTLANQNRPDLGTAFGNPAAVPHGYTFNVPANAYWKDGLPHSIAVKPCGGTGYLVGSGQTLTCQGSPPPPTTGVCGVGNYQGFVDNVNCTSISGWLIDFNNLSKTAIAQIFVDGQFVASVSANQQRPDLGTYFQNPAATPHGYTYYIPANSIIRNGQPHDIQVKACDGVAFLPHHNNSNYSSLQCSGGSGYRLGSSENQVQTINASNELEQEVKLQIYPNPVEDEVNLQFVLITSPNAKLEIIDLSGRVVHQQEIKGWTGTNLISIDLQNLPSGKYEALLTNPDIRLTNSFIKQ